jgi:hypothetical protein
MAVNPRSATPPLIANLAIPVVLVVLALFGGVLLIAVVVLGLYYLFRRISGGSEE